MYLIVIVDRIEIGSLAIAHTLSVVRPRECNKLFFYHLPLCLAKSAFAIALQKLVENIVSRKENTGVL
jgi:hypothetical protein